MPELIGEAILTALGTSAAVAGTTVVVGTVTVAAVVGEVALLGASFAFSAYQNNRLKKSLQQSGIDQGRTVMSRDPIAPRRLIYGQILVSGTVVFLDTTGASNEYLHIVLVLAGHQCESIDTIYFDNIAVPLDGSGDATGTFAGNAIVKKHLGAPGDAADATLIAADGTNWTSAHTLSGCTYLYVQLKYSATLFPNGLPTVTALVKGAHVFDPRDGTQSATTPSTWKFSSNSALCAAHFLNNSAWGKGVVYSRIPSADLIEAANHCDEAVVLADSSTENRYTTNGTVTSDQDPNSVLLDLAGAMAGTIVDTGGLWTVRAGVYRTPSLTFTDKDLVQSISVQPRLSRADTFNGVRGTYISPINSWAAADAPSIVGKMPVTALVAGNRVCIWKVGTTNFTLIGAPNNNVGTMFIATGAGTGTGYVDPYQAQDGGIRLWKDVQLPFTTSAATAQRLFKIILERGRQQITVSALYGMAALSAMPADVVQQTRAQLGWSSKTFEVVDWGFQTYGAVDAPALGVQQTIRETASGVWDWANGEETTVDLAPNTNLPDPSVVATPTGLSLFSDDTTAFAQADGTFVPRLRVTWNLPADIYVTQGGKVHIEYKKHADSYWLVWNEQRGDQTIDYINDVLAGVAYDVRIRFVNNIGVVGADEEVDNYTVGLKAGVPSTPTGGGLTSNGVVPNFYHSTHLFNFGCRIFWDKPSDPDYVYTEFKATTTDADGATDYTWFPVSGPSFTSEKTVTIYNFLLNAGWVRIRHINKSGTPSAWVALGNANAQANTGTGSIATQPQDNPAISSVQTGDLGASNVQKIYAVYNTPGAFSLAGGANDEDVNFDLTHRGFTTAPDSAQVTVLNVPNDVIDASYMPGLSTSTNAVVRVYNRDGSNLSAGGITLAADFTEYA